MRGRRILPVRLGVTLGVIWSLSVLLLSVMASYKWGSLFFRSIEDVYLGCSNKTVRGQIWCTVLGFADGFIAGCLIGVLYNNLPIAY